MGKLPRFTLSHNRSKDRWDLKAEGSDRAKATFDTKAEATAGGALQKALGPSGGSVRIRRLDNTIQEERTFPRSADPKKSPG